MPQLLAVLEPGHSPDAAKHAAEVLAAVARSALSPLARCMAEPSFLQTLLERAFEESGPSSVQVVLHTAQMPMAAVEDYGGTRCAASSHQQSTRSTAAFTGEDTRCQQA